jgi:hypothetical protein
MVNASNSVHFLYLTFMAFFIECNTFNACVIFLFSIDKYKILEGWIVLSEDCMDKSVKNTATDQRDSLSEYFAFHIRLTQ